MKSTNDNPVDPLGTLGAPIRPTVTKPDPVRDFERINDQQKATDDFMRELRKQWGGVVTDGQEDDWKDIV